LAVTNSVTAFCHGLEYRRRAIIAPLWHRRPIFIDKDLCFSPLTGSPESANFTNTFSEVFPMLLRMTEGANRTALMILSDSPGASVVFGFGPKFESVNVSLKVYG
jgi:hypothetical protein